VEYAEAFHYIGPPASRQSMLDDYIKKNAVPIP
jgi:hypothetical protein